MAIPASVEALHRASRYTEPGTNPCWPRYLHGPDTDPEIYLPHPVLHREANLFYGLDGGKASSSMPGCMEPFIFDFPILLVFAFRRPAEYFNKGAPIAWDLILGPSLTGCRPIDSFSDQVECFDIFSRFIASCPFTGYSPSVYKALDLVHHRFIRHWTTPDHL